MYTILKKTIISISVPLTVTSYPIFLKSSEVILDIVYVGSIQLFPVNIFSGLTELLGTFLDQLNV